MAYGAQAHKDAERGLTAEWRTLLLHEQGNNCKTAVIIANQIEEAMLADGWQCGHSFETLATIMNKYGVGRSIARETMRILQMRGTGSLRRGPGGGVVVGQPDLPRTALSLAGLLRSQRVTIGNLAQARQLLNDELSTLGFQTQRRAPIGPITVKDAIEANLTDEQNRAAHSRNPGFILLIETLNILCRSIVDWVATDDATALHALVCDGAGNDFEMLQTSLGVTQNQTLGEITRLRNVDPHLTTGPHAIRIARNLADLVIQGTWDNGKRIGTEQELAERYNVGLLIIRQAIRLVEEHGIAKMRLGRGNGLFVSEAGKTLPAVRMAHGYLASRHWAGQMWWQTLRPIQVALLDGASRAMEPDERQSLRMIIAALGKEPAPGHAMDTQMQIMRRLSMASNNPVLETFWTVVLSYRHRVMTTVCPHARTLVGHLITNSQTFLVDFLDGRTDARDYYAILSASLLPEYEDWVASPFGVN